MQSYLIGLTNWCKLLQGFDSVMADGSHLPLDENISYTKFISSLAHEKGILVEAELGRLSGTEDGLTVEEYESKLTDVTQVVQVLCYISCYFYGNILLECQNWRICVIFLFSPIKP